MKIIKKTPTKLVLLFLFNGISLPHLFLNLILVTVLFLWFCFERTQMDEFTCNRFSSSQGICKLETSYLGLKFKFKQEIQLSKLYKVVSKVNYYSENPTSYTYFLDKDNQILLSRKDEHYTNNALYVSQINAFLKNSEQSSIVVRGKHSETWPTIHIFVGLLIFLFSIDLGETIILTFDKNQNFLKIKKIKIFSDKVKYCFFEIIGVRTEYVKLEEIKDVKVLEHYHQICIILADKSGIHLSYSILTPKPEKTSILIKDFLNLL